MKRLVYVLAIVAAVSSIVDAKYSGGSGTPAAPYQISSTADLLALAADTGDYDKCFVLTTDIDLDPDLPGGQVFATAVIAPDTDGTTWSFEGVGFTGIFDGAGHKIINLAIDTAGAGNGYLGLFGSLEGEVKNLGLENVTITSGISCEIGGLAGCNFGDISNCYSTGTVSGSSGVGGLVGSNQHGDMSDCYSTVEVACGDYARYLGGLAGDNYMGSISNCHATGAVSGGDYSENLGGLVGLNDVGTGLKGDISNCYATGAVIAEAESGDLGGLVGFSNGSISNCYSTGAVTSGDHPYDLGGLVGGNSYGSISNCYSTGAVAGGYDSSMLGGLVGSDVGGTTRSCLSTGNVTGGSDSFYLGGLVGWNGSTISNCYSTGAVHGGDESVDIGGLVGKNYSGTVVDCYSTGAVSGGGGSICLGGLVGWKEGGNISDCYFLITSGPANGYGQPLTDAQMKQQVSFVGWDFIGETANGTDDIWVICEGIGYPRLAWQYVPGIAFPLPDAVLAGEVTLAAYTGEDSGVAGVYFYLREPDGPSGTAIGYEDLVADFNDTTRQWEYNFDTTQVSNGDYIILAKAVDGCDNAVFSDPVPVVVFNLEVTKCTVAAGSKDNSDTISISGQMGATADDFGGASVIEVTVDSDDIVNPCVQTFAIDGKTFKKGKYSYSGTQNGVKKSFKYDVKTHKFTFSASNIELSGLGCPVTVEIRVGDYVGTGQVDEAIVNGPKKPIPLRLMMGVKNVLRVDSCKVTAGVIGGSDTILVSGEMSVTSDEMSDADHIQVTVDSVDMVSPCVQSFPIDEQSFKKGKYNYARTEDASKLSFKFDTKTGKFSFTAKNVNLSGLACPLTIEVVIGAHICADEVDEAIVNGPKSPIPIKLMMGVKNVLRVDSHKVTRGKKPTTDQLSVKGGFAVEDINVNLVNEEFVVTLGTQTFTLPVGSFKAGKNQFTCSKAEVTEGGIAYVTFNFKTCSFTIIIKNTEVVADAGVVDFGVEFADFNEEVQIVLP